MVFITETELTKDINRRKKDIIKFIGGSREYLPKGYEGFIPNQIKIALDLDRSGFLTWTTGIENFAFLMTFLDKQQIDISKANLFEAGAYSKFHIHKNTLYHPDIPYFMASGQNQYNYFGFDPKNQWGEEDLEQIFSKESKYNITENINKNKFRKNLRNILTNDFELFEKKVFESTNPVIFSNFVLGCPNFDLRYKFVNLPGLHVHQFLRGDVAKYRKEEEGAEWDQRLFNYFEEYFKLDPNKMNLFTFLGNDVLWYKN